MLCLLVETKANCCLALSFSLQVLPVVVFFSAFVYMCYYLGVMQVVIKKIAWVMQVTMATSAAESLNAAGNIFIGQVRMVQTRGPIRGI